MVVVVVVTVTVMMGMVASLFIEFQTLYLHHLI